MTVQTFRPKLTEDDIRRLVRGATELERAQAAHKICRRIDQAELSDAERSHAQVILEMMVADAAEMVRGAMSVTLRNSPNLPHDIALKLANDIEKVALPVLQSSPVLTEDDLIELVAAFPPAKQAAIAKRDTVPPRLTETIAQHGHKQAVEELAANDGAQFTGKAYAHTLRRFRDDDAVKEKLIHRERLPVIVAEKLVTMVSGQLFDYLVNHHELPPQMAIDLASGARERATIDLVDQAGRATDMRRFVQQLNLNGRLTPSILLRSVCLGHIRFFEWGMAELAGIDHSKAWLMIHDGGDLGLRAIYDHAGLPPRLFPAVKAAIRAAHMLEHDGARGDRERFSKKMVERVLTLTQAMPSEDLAYLLDRLDGFEGRRADVEKSKSDPIRTATTSSGPASSSPAGASVAQASARGARA